jgi:hypothetical protein
MTIMIKCGTLAAVVIAGSAAGTATLVSNPPNADGLAASDHSATEQTTAVRGTRSMVETVDSVTSPVSDQPRRGERPDHQPVTAAVAVGAENIVRRGIR